MKIGISSYSLSKAINKGEIDVFGAIEYIASIGGEHMEIVPGAIGQFTTDDDPMIEKIKAAAAAAKIDLSSYTIGANFISTEEGVDPIEFKNKEVARIKEQVKIAAHWPKNIPLLPGAKDLSVMVFPKRNAIYASCFVPNTTRPQLVHEMSKRLLSNGWQAASDEIANPFKASGEVFLRENPLELLLLGISKTAPEGTTLTVYTRPLETKKVR